MSLYMMVGRMKELFILEEPEYKSHRMFPVTCRSPDA